MKKTATLLGVLAAVLAGCATSGHYGRTLEPWIGASADELARIWGPPDATETLDEGRRALIYLEERIFNIAIGSDGDPRVLRRSCETTFYLTREGVIAGINAQGNFCGRGIPIKVSV